jgi:beta-mannosidase
MDSLDVTFGLRTVELEQNPGSSADAALWTLVINGHPEFIRGANWVPADSIPARVTPQDYAALLEMARAANINLLRVWGGGLKEKDEFYDLCDELGILVWQEFPFSGAGIDYFPRDDDFLALARQECDAIVTALRNHPSVVLWCGGNEFIPRANRHVIEIMRHAVAKRDGTRPFKPASPSHDESHNWRVWHGLANTRDYEDDKALFFGEFGLQAPPNVETLARFLPDDQLFPPNDWWDYHNAERAKLWRYADPILKAREIQEISLEHFVAASQEAQLRGLQIAIEHARRSKPRVSGCAFWQFNEPWYSICWSVVDYARTPKRAYAKIKELYNPILVSFAYPLRRRAPGEIVSGLVWLINDTLQERGGTLWAWQNDELLLTRDVAIAPNDSRVLQALDLLLEPGRNDLRFELRGEGVYATNEYDLNYSDSGEINPRRAFLTNAAAWLRTST